MYKFAVFQDVPSWIVLKADIAQWCHANLTQLSGGMRILNANLCRVEHVYISLVKDTPNAEGSTFGLKLDLELWSNIYLPFGPGINVGTNKNIYLFLLENKNIHPWEWDLQIQTRKTHFLCPRGLRLSA